MIKVTEPALFTGYYEAELDGSLARTGWFQYPIYAVPDEVRAGGIWKTRKDIEENEVLKGRGLELAWVENPADIFFMQIQGSGRVRLQDGSTLRLGFGGSNGRRYQAIGPHLVELGVLQEHEVSANRIKEWVLNNPKKGQEIVWENPAYVFFRRVDDVPSDQGPRGAMNRSLTTLRTLAVDPKYVTLGAPIWLEKGGSRPLNRLMIAQDTGSAITGPQRADVFFGTGDQAGIAAGLTKDSGRMILLLPIQEARARVSGL
jgi:membrane-bound lytic murein transglycosylase A